MEQTFKIGDFVRGTINNGYAITKDGSLLIVTEVSPSGATFDGVLIAHDNPDYLKKIGGTFQSLHTSGFYKTSAKITVDPYSEIKWRREEIARVTEQAIKDISYHKSLILKYEKEIGSLEDDLNDYPF